MRESDVGWPLDELWIGSELLDSPAELEATPLILVLDAPPEELTWLALHPAGDWICEQLRLTKRPISWRYRPSVYPAWNCRDRRVVRFWSGDAGYDGDVIEALRERQSDRLQIVTPSETEFAGQLQQPRWVRGRRACLVPAGVKVMTLAEVPQCCSPKFPTWVGWSGYR